MNKEEILLAAKKENKGLDLADLNIQQKGAYISYFVGIIGIILVNIIEVIVLNKANFGSAFIMTLMISIAFIYKYIKLKKKHEFFVALGYLSLSLMFLVFWILVLVRVW